MRRTVLQSILFIALLWALLSAYAVPAAQQCPGCGGPADPTLKIKASACCGPCFDKVPKTCYGCSATCLKVHVVDGSWFCDSCYGKLNRCAKCGKPFVVGYRIDKAATCTQCARAMLGKCAMCKAFLEGGGTERTNTLTMEKRSFCDPCEKRYRKCDACSWLVAGNLPGQWDGRYLCADCFSTVVKSTDELTALYQEVLQLMAEKLGLAIRKRPQLLIVGVKQMSALRKAEGRSDDCDVFGLYTSMVEKYSYQLSVTYNVKDPKIRILYPLPLQATYMTVAHESGHAWFAENTKCRTADLSIIEGFAEWVAYKVLLMKNGGAVARAMTVRYDEYGRGLRLFLEKEKAAGYAETLKWTRTF